MNKKLILGLLALSVATLSLLFAADAPAPTTETYLFRIQTDPNAGAAPTATAFFGERATVNGLTYEGPMRSYTWPLQSDKPVTVGDVTLTYAQVSAFVVAIAYQEKATAEAPPAPAP